MKGKFNLPLAPSPALPPFPVFPILTVLSVSGLFVYKHNTRIRLPWKHPLLPGPFIIVSEK
ncbi:hypothetical protein AKJ61_03665 [candidate division MSBL1 archaeon SCGC-AAA259B11]|uniref:Uncharacterized protein n=1 Tax=candidate division MSBL1 archaeon SCGC-AAA259B11 TaxID=1698260 RepID=A0A133U4F9_9EURY|nr:hypothetical protein AKJ61_03665 [candidate division MSBL1 archaeon SCGC-AAA259B11]